MVIVICLVDQVVILKSGYGLNLNFNPCSNCLLFFRFSLAPVEKRVVYCSNRSVVCKLCRNFFWSYNMQSHYEDRHQGSPFDEGLRKIIF